MQENRRRAARGVSWVCSFPVKCVPSTCSLTEVIHVRQPTAEEKEVALAQSGRWVDQRRPTPILTLFDRWIREGVYRFSFELRKWGFPLSSFDVIDLKLLSISLAKTVLYNSKEAHNHTFTYKVRKFWSISLRWLCLTDRLQIGDGMYNKRPIKLW